MLHPNVYSARHPYYLNCQGVPFQMKESLHDQKSSFRREKNVLCNHDYYSY